MSAPLPLAGPARNLAVPPPARLFGRCWRDQCTAKPASPVGLCADCLTELREASA